MSNSKGYVCLRYTDLATRVDHRRHVRPSVQRLRPRSLLRHWALVCTRIPATISSLAFAAGVVIIWTIRKYLNSFFPACSSGRRFPEVVWLAVAWGIIELAILGSGPSCSFFLLQCEPISFLWTNLETGFRFSGNPAKFLIWSWGAADYHIVDAEPCAAEAFPRS